MPCVVFVTAFDEYAIQAFEKSAVDYLLKPVQPERLVRALARVKRFLGEGRTPSYDSPPIERIQPARTQILFLLQQCETEAGRE